MAEWLKAPVLKTGRRASVSRVRIPPHPPAPHDLTLGRARTFGVDHVRCTALFQGRKRLRLDDDGLIVMKAAPKRERRGEDRQNGDQTHTHTSPLRRALILTD